MVLCGVEKQWLKFLITKNNILVEIVKQRAFVIGIVHWAQGLYLQGSLKLVVVVIGKIDYKTTAEI